MSEINNLIKKWKTGTCTIREKLLLCLLLCLVTVCAIEIRGTFIKICLFINPYIEPVFNLAVTILGICELACLIWYFEMWIYGGVKVDARKFYPCVQNAVFLVASDVYTALGIVKPKKRSAVASISQKVFYRGTWVVYQCHLLLQNPSDEVNTDDIKSIIQNELVRKSVDGFEGIEFDEYGYPYLKVDSIAVDGSYLVVQIVVFWNQEEEKKYEIEKENKETRKQANHAVEDEVF